jgi:hypothetical protein
MWTLIGFVFTAWYLSTLKGREEILTAALIIIGILAFTRPSSADVRDLECYKKGSCTIYRAPQVERSVWTNYSGLYKLHRMSEKCARFAGPDCLKPIRTWHAECNNNKQLTTKQKRVLCIKTSSEQ